MARVHISWHILLFLLVEVMALGRGRKCRHRAYSNFAFITSVLHLPEFVLGACYSCGSHLERAHLGGDQALSQRQGCRMEMHKLLALLWFHLMGGVGVCWAWRQAKCFWQINWKSTTSSTTDEGFWHSPYSVTVSCLKISAVPQWEMPFAFWITPPWWGAGALAGFGNCRIAFRREVTTHTRVTPLLSLLKSPGLVSGFFLSSCHAFLLFPLCFQYPFFPPFSAYVSLMEMHWHNCRHLSRQIILFLCHLDVVPFQFLLLCLSPSICISFLFKTLQTSNVKVLLIFSGKNSSKENVLSAAITVQTEPEFQLPLLYRRAALSGELQYHHWVNILAWSGNRKGIKMGIFA